MNISGDMRVSSSSSESLMESPNNFLKEILSETGVSRSLLDSALVGVTITGRARRASSRGLISADGAGWGSVFGGRAAKVLGFSTSVEGSFDVWSGSFCALASLLAFFKKGGSVYIVLLPLGFQGGRAGH